MLFEGNSMFDLAAVQAAIRENGVDGWLLYDFRGLNVLARRVIGMTPDAHATRRWFYFIPASGEPRKLVHRIEQGVLDSLPGKAVAYSGWQELHKSLPKLLSGASTIAMQYSPD